MKLTKFAVYKNLATTAIIVALVVLGIYGLTRIPVDFLPQVTYPVIKLQIRWPGSTASEIDQEIAEPVEKLMAPLDKLDYISSSSREGFYALDINFQYGADIDAAFQDVLAALTRVKQSLPEDSEEPFVFKADPSQLPVLQLAVNSETWSPVELRDWTENWLQEKLLAAEGVAGSEITGGQQREIRVLIDTDALEKYKIALDTVINKIAVANIEVSSGRITVGKKEIIARNLGRFKNLSELKSVIIQSKGYHQIKLSDIAEVIDSHKEERIINRFNQKNSVKIAILKEAEANTVKTAETVERLLDKLQSSLPEGIEISKFDNQAVYVKQALKGVSNAAIFAVALLIIVVYLFLGSFRQVIIMITVLPLTLLLNFGLMKLAGFSLNIFSLGGLVVAIGVILDNSIIVLENINRHRKTSPEKLLNNQAISAVSEVQPALIAATLSFLALFVPFLIVPGLTSLLFRELIMVIAGIVIISLIIAITVTPMMFTILFRKDLKKSTKRRAGWFDKLFTRLTENYEKMLSLSIKRHWLTLMFFLILIVLAGFFFKSLGSEFLPRLDDGRVVVKVKMPTGASIGQTDAILKKIEKQISNDKYIEDFFAIAGGQVKGLTTFEVANEGEINIQIIPKSKRDITTGEYVGRLRKKINKLQPPGGKIMVKQMPPHGIKGSRGSDIIVQIRGQNINVLENISQEAMQKMNALNRFENVSLSLNLTKPEYQIKFDRVKLDALGLTIAQVATYLRFYISGKITSQYFENNRYYDIRLIVNEKEIASKNDLENLPLFTKQGNFIRVRDIAKVKTSSGPVEISREDQSKQITVEADITDRDIAEAVNHLENALSEIDLPVGYEINFGGSSQMMNDMKNTVMQVFAFALFFSFIVLTVQFNDLKLPLLVLGSVLVSLTGSVFLLLFTNVPFGATVIIGILVVIAATVNDGVLLINFADELSKIHKYNPVKAVVESAKIRMRPRIMTSLTTMVGFYPLAINLGDGADMLQPMAIAAIGGLIVEILVTLFLMPVLYSFKKK